MNELIKIGTKISEDGVSVSIDRTSIITIALAVLITFAACQAVLVAVRKIK